MKRSDIKITLDKEDEFYGECYIISRKNGREETYIPRTMAKEIPNFLMSILKDEPFEFEVVEY